MRDALNASASPVHVGICRLTLLAGHSRSLKDKRQIVRKLKDRVRAKYHVQLSEVGGQDTWQRVVLGFAVVSGERKRAEALLDEIAGFIRITGDRTGQIDTASDEREILSFEDGALGEIGGLAGPLDAVDPRAHPPAAAADDDSWIPAAWKDDAGE